MTDHRMGKAGSALQAEERGHYVWVDVSISVNPEISVWEGHDIARSVKQQLMKRFIHVSNVVIYVQPYDPGYPYKPDLGVGTVTTIVH